MPIRKTPRVYDSLTGMEFRHGVWAVSYEPIWQQIRDDLGFKTVESVRSAQIILDAYILLSSDPQQRARRLFRIVNTLRAIPLGQVGYVSHIRIIERKAEDIIFDYRQAITAQYDAGETIAEWDWNISRERLKVFWDVNPELMHTLYTHYVRNRLPRPGKKITLRYYLKLNEEVSNNFTFKNTE